MAAAKAMLHETHTPLPQRPGDDNSYTLGEIFGHNVVLACLPVGMYGTTSATAAAVNMLSTYRQIRFGLMVGIGGGVPSRANDIRLGDIVVSRPSGSSGGVVQYDYGKTIYGGQFEHTGTLDKPSQALLTAVSNVQSNEMMGKRRVSEFLAEIPVKYPALSRFTYPHGEMDQLYQAEYEHRDQGMSCEECECDQRMLVQRPARLSYEPKVFYGLIASGNQVMKHGRTRDQLAAEHGIICFEMEAAGLMDHFPCLVIRGICDYADSHKNKQWQEYAAATAAAYAKEILSVVAVAAAQASNKPLVNVDSADFEMTEHDEECLRGLFLVDPEEDKNALKRRKGDRAPGTCEWILETQELQRWLNGDIDSNILWLYGNPGTGKSTIAIALAEWLPNRMHSVFGKLMYFFCDSTSEDRRTATAILRGLLYQLVQQQRHLLQFFRAKYEAQKDRLFSSFDAMWSILLAIANDEGSEDQYYCMIDALDECDPATQEILLTQLKHTFTSQPGQKLRILVTSRPYPEIACYLRLFNHTDLASYDEVKSDIRSLIDTRVSELKRTRRYTENISQHVSAMLLEKAEGTFLWVGIACEELTRVRSRDAVRTLEKLPRGLDALYQELLDAALDRNKDDREAIIQMLGFVAISRRPFTLSQLSAACQSYNEYDEADRLVFLREDIELCRLIIIIQDNTVRLLHKSVTDFLLRQRENRPIHDLKAHAMLANRCISHLLYAGKVAGAANREAEDEFIWYSVDFWPEHAHLAQAEFAILDEHVAFFSASSEHRNMWLELYNRRSDMEAPLGSSTLHTAARWGIPVLIQYSISLLSGSPAMEGRRDSGGTCKGYEDSEFEVALTGFTPLAEAAMAGHIGIMELLLESGHPEMKVGSTIVEAAALNEDNGHIAIKLLLERRKSNIEVTEMAIRTAAENEGCGKGIVNAILDHCGEQVRVTEEILMAAAANVTCGQEIARLLLAHGQIPSPMDLEFAMFVFRSFQVQTVRWFLDRAGSEILRFPDVLVAATRNPDAAQVASFLLSHSSKQVPITEDLWENVVHSKYDRVEVMRLFLNYDSQLILTERLAMAVASHDWEARMDLMMVILRESKTQIAADKTVEVIARWFNADVMKLLLDKPDHLIRVTDSVLGAATSNRNKEHREKLIELLKDVQKGQIDSMEAVHTRPAPEISDQKCAITQARVLKGHTDEIWVSAFSHHGLRLATGSRDGTITSYSVPDFAILDTLAGRYNGRITCLAWNKTDTLLAAGSQDGNVVIWDIETGSPLRPLPQYRKPVCAITWMNDGESFVCQTLDASMSLAQWNVQGECLRQFSGASRGKGFCITPDETQLIVAGAGKRLIFYNLQARHNYHSDTFPLDSEPTCVTASQDSKHILVTLRSSEIQLINTVRKTITRCFRGQHAGRYIIRSVFFGARESYVLSGSEDSRVYVWDRESGALVDILEGHEIGCVNSVSVNPVDPDMLVSTGDDRTCRVWMRQGR
ncbi:hypothetical protein BJY00DRAFT_320196 [Aspergillus carlsbadensis]|nr:hypothetical protein BJY00DRAFT_320196 [Aspergillus carlsbadensis]